MSNESDQHEWFLGVISALTDAIAELALQGDSILPVELEAKEIKAKADNSARGRGRRDGAELIIKSLNS
jgi:hypothetical protein